MKVKTTTNLIIIRNIKFLFLILILFSCRETRKQVTTIVKQKDKNNSEIVFFHFQDTLEINENAEGSLKYDLRFKDINDTLIDTRYTLLYLTAQQDIVVDLESIKKVEHEIFLDETGEGIFHFKAKFNNLGQNMLKGVIEDVTILKPLSGEEKIRIITKNIKIEKDVFITP